jgi:uncharacterized membrane protein YdjX (TVP38/TMEM64 family)
VIKEPEGQGSRNRLGKDLLTLLLTGVFFFGLALLIRHGIAGENRQWLHELRQWLQGSELGSGLWSSSMVFVVLGATAISVGVPRLWVSGAAGVIYGLTLGSILALASSTIGAAILFFLGRRMLAGLVERRFSGRTAVWRARFRADAFWWVLYCRLFPMSNATLTSLLCGACQIPVTPYLLASLLGFVPLTLVFAAFGSGGIKGDTSQIILGFGFLVAAMTLRYLFKIMRPAAQVPDVR